MPREETDFDLASVYLTFVCLLNVGGSLVTPSVVLTSANCLFDVRAVQIGRYDFREDEQGVETYTELETRTHPQFDSTTLDFDYGLIKLDSEQPDPFLVGLRRTRELPRDLVIMGWGLTLNEGEQSEILMHGNVSRFDTTRCENNYDPEPVTESMFCANGDGVDICNFDEGGPVIIPGTNVQVGTASWGLTCANATLPGVYSHMFWGFEWVEETICEDISPDDCTEEGRMKIVDTEGQAVDATCEDREMFLGLGKKLLNRNCTWVGGRKDQRCEWYGEDYCPDTCAVERCQVQ